MAEVQTKSDTDVVVDAIVRYIGKQAESISNLEAAAAVRSLKKEILQIKHQAAAGQLELVEKAWLWAKGP